MCKFRAWAQGIVAHMCALLWSPSIWLAVFQGSVLHGCDVNAKSPRAPQEIKRWHRIEAWGFLPLYAYKFFAGLGDGALRSLYRLGLLVTFPGLNDHLPSEYESRLRRALPKGGCQTQGQGDGSK